MHGGARGSGAPAGERNGAYVAGQYTKDAIDLRRDVRDWLALTRATLDEVE